MKPLLLTVEPFDIAAGARTLCRIADGLSSQVYGVNGQKWFPAVTARPQISLDLMSLDLDGTIQPARLDMEITLNELPADVNWRAAKWIGAPILLWSAEELEWSRRRSWFTGQVRSQRLDSDAGTLRLTAEAVNPKLERNLLFAVFDGSGGLGGEAGVRGTLMPAGFGIVPHIEPVWFDKTRWIGMLDGYGNLQSVQRLLEGGNDLGPVFQDYPTYAALAAAIDAKAVPRGRWATCIASGLVGLGAPPEGPLGAFATFGANNIGEIIDRICSVHALMPTSEIDLVSLSSLDIELPFPVHAWFKDQRRIIDVVQSLAASANATPLLLPNGKLAVSRGTLSAPVATLNRNGASQPRVIDWQVADPVAPFWQIKARTSRPARVLTFDEVNYADTITDMGAYKPAEVYRQGNVVWLSNKSSWLYRHNLPTAGNAPPIWPATQNTWWVNLTPPSTAGDLLYADGTPIEALKPLEAGANVTETRIAFGIPNQGALATKNAVSWGSEISARPAMLTDTQFVGGYERIRSPFLFDPASGTTMEGRWPAEFGANVTEIRTAFAIQGQGPGATAPANDVLNYKIDNSVVHVAAPGGASINYTGGEIVGNLRITLPVGADGAMVSFEVDVFDYAVGRSCKYLISGYAYNLGGGVLVWTNQSVYFIGPEERARPVWFGRINGKHAVRIGTASSSWSYPQVMVRNFKAGYTPGTATAWKDGWAVGFYAAALDAEDVSVAKPRAGDAVFGEGIKEAPGGAIATRAAYRTDQGIAFGFQGQGVLATLNAIVDGYLGGNLAARIAPYPGSPTYLSAITIAYSNGSGLDGLRPQEAGANVTETRIAFGIPNQGALATKNQVGAGDFAVASLSAISANIGFLVSYNGQGGRVERDGNGTRVYDDNGQLRLRIGFW